MKKVMLVLVMLSTSSIFANGQIALIGGSPWLLPIGILVLLFVVLVLFFVRRYKRCPSDRVLVVYGKTGGDSSAKVVHGGASFIWPIIQDYGWLDLKPMSIDVDLTDALSKQNIRVSVPAQYTIAISKNPTFTLNAAERLLGLDHASIRSLAKDIIMGQMRLVIANMDIEELNADRDKFIEAVFNNVGTELHKVGLELINVNVTDIHDESGYISALGQEAAAQAINDANVKVAQETKKGEIGVAIANKEQRVQTSAENAQAEVGEANAQARATEGKNKASVEIAESDSQRRQSVAEANKEAEIVEKTTVAEAKKEAYEAETKAENARKERELAQKRADEVVQSTITAEKVVIDAEAEANKVRKLAKGEADAILAKATANAEGIQKVLTAQADGFKELVIAANGDAQAAIGLLMVDKVEKLAEIQVEAIKNIKFDKVTVFDGGSGESVSNFIGGVTGMLPALSDFMGENGLNLPNYLAQKSTKEPSKSTNSKQKTKNKNTEENE